MNIAILRIPDFYKFAANNIIMNSIYLFIQFLLAALFAIAGILKISQPKQKLSRTLPWTRDFKPATIKFIGFCEFSAALGLAGPTVLGFGYRLTPWAAIGISIIMALAGIYHSRRKEYSSLIVNALLLVSALVVAFYK